MKRAGTEATTTATAVSATLLLAAAPAGFAAMPIESAEPGLVSANGGMETLEQWDDELDWASARWWSPFETSREHYDALQEAAGGGTRHTRESIPDWSGYWEIDWSIGEIQPFFNLSTVEGMMARLTPEHQEIFASDLRAWDNEQAVDPLSWCLPPHFPRWYMEYGFRDKTTHPDKTLLISEMMNEIRRVYTDGRDHPSPEWIPQGNEWLGDSIGFWDDDILVIHTTHIKEGILQRRAPRQSDQISTVERLRMVDENTIEVEITMYDPVVQREPWHTVARFIKNSDDTDAIRARHWSCVEGNNWVMREDGTITQMAPGDPGFIDITDPDVWFDERYIHR
jgi:hypothetical protein